MFDSLWHGLLRQPYKLHKPLDVGQGIPVVLLHGIGRSGTTWQSLVKRLPLEKYRTVTFDLLGFGRSPKPSRINYSIDDHAQAVIAAIKRQHFGQPAIVVGHSLGSLVALRVARLRPDLVRHVVLYEMPLYDGLPEKRHYKARLAVYNRFYQWVLKQQPSFGEAKRRFSERVATQIVGLEITRDTWQPLIKSLQNSIMTQTAADDIKHLKMRADVVYGTRDIVVIRGKVADIFGVDITHVTGHTVRAGHRISVASAAFLAKRIEYATTP